MVVKAKKKLIVPIVSSVFLSSEIVLLVPNNALLKRETNACAYN